MYVVLTLTVMRGRQPLWRASGRAIPPSLVILPPSRTAYPSWASTLCAFPSRSGYRHPTTCLLSHCQIHIMPQQQGKSNAFMMSLLASCSCKETATYGNCACLLGSQMPCYQRVQICRACWKLAELLWSHVCEAREVTCQSGILPLLPCRANGRASTKCLCFSQLHEIRQ